jgi:hypothetical protein
MTEEVRYADEDERSQAIARWNVHYNYHRPHYKLQVQMVPSQCPETTTVRPSIYR